MSCIKLPRFYHGTPEKATVIPARPGEVNKASSNMASTMLQTERKQLRRAILANRDRLTPDERGQRSMAATANLLALDEIRNAKTIFTYVHFRSEVETLPFIRQCLGRGIRICVPRTLPHDHRLEPILISDPAQDLAPGYCGIPEPRRAFIGPPLDPGSIDVVLAPGSVFDPEGGRLGYGGGYYDRFLAEQASQALRVGLAFELQVVDRVPLLDHDQRLHILVTETRIIRCTGHAAVRKTSTEPA